MEFGLSEAEARELKGVIEEFRSEINMYIGRAIDRRTKEEFGHLCWVMTEFAQSKLNRNDFKIVFDLDRHSRAIRLGLSI